MAQKLIPKLLSITTILLWQNNDYYTYYDLGEVTTGGGFVPWELILLLLLDKLFIYMLINQYVTPK